MSETIKYLRISSSNYDKADNSKNKYISKIL